MPNHLHRAIAISIGEISRERPEKFAHVSAKDLTLWMKKMTPHALTQLCEDVGEKHSCLNMIAPVVDALLDYHGDSARFADLQERAEKSYAPVRQFLRRYQIGNAPAP